MKMPNDHIKMIQSDNSILQKGDVFFVQDSHGETYSHILIKFAQWITHNTHPSIVHAGIAIDSRKTIEMCGSGIGQFTIDDIHGQSLIIFRSKDKEISDFAADLAGNLVSSDFEKDDPLLKVSRKKIDYSFWKAMLSVLNYSYEISRSQKEEIDKLINDFKFSNKMFCTELVTLLIAISRRILTNDKESKQPNLHYTNPSQLYEYLSCDPAWERIEMKVIRNGKNVRLASSTTCENDKDYENKVICKKLLPNLSLFCQTAANDDTFDQTNLTTQQISNNFENKVKLCFKK